MRTKVLCNADCGYNRNGVCQRSEIAITVLMQGGCVENFENFDKNVRGK